jgi:hypothetical protein
VRQKSGRQDSGATQNGGEWANTKFIIENPLGTAACGDSKSDKTLRGGSYRARENKSDERVRSVGGVLLGGQQERQTCEDLWGGVRRGQKHERQSWEEGAIALWESNSDEVPAGAARLARGADFNHRRHQTETTRARKKQRRVGGRRGSTPGRSAQGGIARGDALRPTLLRWASASRAVGTCVCESVDTSCSTQVGDWETPSAPPSKTLRQSQTRSYPRRSWQAGES